MCRREQRRSATQVRPHSTMELKQIPRKVESVNKHDFHLKKEHNVQPLKVKIKESQAISIDLLDLPLVLTEMLKIFSCILAIQQ